MTKVTILSPKEIKEQLKDLPGWKFAKNKLFKEFQFEHFMDSLKFITKMAPFFEKNDHHPDTHIFYNKVLFELQRFDVGGKVTDKDFLVAHKLEDTYNKRSKSSK